MRYLIITPQFIHASLRPTVTLIVNEVKGKVTTQPCHMSDSMNYREVRLSVFLDKSSENRQAFYMGVRCLSVQ